MVQNPRSEVRWQFLPLSLLLGLGGLWGWLGWLAPNLAEVSGLVMDAGGPVAGARVRVRATENLTLTNAFGEFTLSGLAPGEEVEVTAWAEGYYIASKHVTPTANGVVLTLRRYHTSDHSSYAWASPFSGPGACSECHPMIIDQWQDNAHGSAINNPRFYSLYNATDVSGTQKIGPGYLDDFPGTAGNCANCHAPGLAVDGYMSTNMNAARGLITSGIHCDFCHKIGGVYLDPASGSVYPNTPGVQSERVLRPPPGDNIFFGPYDDIHDPDTYLPLISESQFCAPCHQFSFWGTSIYASFDEWLASPYAEEGVTCQDCHMPPAGDDYFALPEAGGLPHPPESIPAHLQLGATSTALLQDSVTMTVAANQMGGLIHVTVAITNTGAGHHVPSDHPGRHLILTVETSDGQGLPLTQVGGPTVPDWGGAQAGQPGAAFAKVLQDAITGQFPVVSYWKQTLLISDNRIPARDSAASEFVFVAPKDGNVVSITGELRFRRLFQDVMDAKDWQTPDVMMEQITTTIRVEPWWDCFLPVVSHGMGH
jgi:hypothetical protein